MVEIGARAAAALERARSAEVVMEFSRGEVLQTDRGEIVWVDADPEAFSPCGVLRAGSYTANRTHGTHRPCSAEEAAFLHDLRAGIPFSQAARHLLGLGPGLTPSGDDFLGGFLFVLARRGTPQRIDTAATHPISRARLAMHMSGEGTRAEARFIDALLGGRDTGVAERILRSHGHSSGDDFIRGARAALARA
jgi:hypothetical protein